MTKYAVSGVAGFPVEDITHKPKRRQGDSIIQSKSTEADVLNSTDSDVLEVVTLERAIKYYKDLSSKDLPNKKLYSATYSWLDELLHSRSSKTIAESRKSLQE